ncbi:MAG: hypothetical protein AAFZ09_14355, partial [Pseudomonadota bacterium]
MPAAMPAGGIGTLSKICDIYDWFDPAVDHILRRCLRVMPGANRRSWEFAMIYLALHRAGVLVPGAEGLGMGVGTERLIYALAERVGRVRATDLYAPGSAWVGVRTDDPQALAAVSRAAYERVQRKYTWAAKAAQTHQVYEWILGRRAEK